MNHIKVISPSKINLTLDIHGKSENGYHLMRSIIMPCWEYADHMIFTKSKEPGISLKITGQHGSKLKNTKENLIMKAADSFFKTTKITPTIKIQLQKNIPIASGLGGGSSNAATTLLALNKLYDAPLSEKKLYTLAKNIGMDVSFFLNPQLSLVTHFGEKITPIVKKNPLLPEIKLIFPKIKNHLVKKHSTKSQYEHLDLSLCGKKKSATVKLLKLFRTSPKIWDSSWNNLLHNDFEQLYQPQSSAHLTGSGPAQFMIRATS